MIQPPPIYPWCKFLKPGRDDVWQIFRAIGDWAAWSSLHTGSRSGELTPASPWWWSNVPLPLPIMCSPHSALGTVAPHEPALAWAGLAWPALGSTHWCCPRSGSSCCRQPAQYPVLRLNKGESKTSFQPHRFCLKWHECDEPLWLTGCYQYHSGHTTHRTFGYQTGISKLNNIKHALMGRKNFVLSVKHIVDITPCPWRAGCLALAGYQIKATFRINSQTTVIRPWAAWCSDVQCTKFLDV